MPPCFINSSDQPADSRARGAQSEGREASYNLTTSQFMALNTDINYILLVLRSHWLHDASVTWRLVCKWFRREEEEESGSVVYTVTHWLLWALGRAYKIISADSVKNVHDQLFVFAILSPFNHERLCFGLNMLLKLS